MIQLQFHRKYGSFEFIRSHPSAPAWVKGEYEMPLVESRGISTDDFPRQFSKKEINLGVDHPL